MPPIEAALSGNKVIGYTGAGGMEYWKGKIFKKVENGEIGDFGQKVLWCQTCLDKNIDHIDHE